MKETLRFALLLTASMMAIIGVAATTSPTTSNTDAKPSSTPAATAPAATAPADNRNAKGSGADATDTTKPNTAKTAPRGRTQSPEIFFPSEQVPSDRPVALPADI